MRLTVSTFSAVGGTLIVGLILSIVFPTVDPSVAGSSTPTQKASRNYRHA